MKTTNADILEKLDRLQELVQGEKIDSSNIQVDECFDIDDYLIGMFNGLEIGIALLEDRKVELRV